MEERAGAGRAEGGLEGGGSLLALIEEGEEDEEGRRKGLTGEVGQVRLDKRSAGARRRRTRMRLLI